MSLPALVPDRTAAPPRRAVNRLLKSAATLAAVAGLAVAAYAARDRWAPVLFPPPSAGPAADSGGHAEPAARPPVAERVSLSEQAQRNLRLTSEPLKAGSFWKTITVPGMVTDRPGVSDRGVVSPAAGVVARIHKVAGDAARPGEVLVTVRLLSESLQLTQTELYRATQDITLAQAQRGRLAESGGAVPQSRLIEIDGQILRLEASARAYRQELLNRGLSAAQIDAAAKGAFTAEIPVAVPAWASGPAPAVVAALRASAGPSPDADPEPPAFEVQELRVELGQQVQAGQALCLLADHRFLAIEGRAFRDESPLLERAVAGGWPVGVDFGEESAPDWPPLGQSFQVSAVANTIDPESRTFRFLMPLDNQSRSVESGGRTRTLWRFRPGQRVRLSVPTERIDGVFVLPADAVAREGADAFVFRQSGDTFDRKAVTVVYQDRTHAVVADDGSVSPGVYVAQAGAARLNRVVKSQSGTVPKGFHVHADGSVHAAH